jgi:hypothetical protein
MLEVLAWLIVALEIQIGIGLIVFSAFRWSGGFAHMRLAGVAVTVYTTRQGRRGVEWRQSIG